MANTVADLRSSLATALSSVSGWRESTSAPGIFGTDPQPSMHKSFAVGIVETLVSTAEGRHVNDAAGVMAETMAEVRWGYLLRADAQVSDHAAALTAEAALIAACCGIPRSGGAKVRLDRAQRDTSQSGWMLGTLRFRIIHQLPTATV